MKKMLNTLKNELKTSPLQFMVVIINLLIGTIFVLASLSESIKAVLVSLICLVPFLISLIILKVRIKLINKKNTKIISNIIVMLLIVPFLFLHLTNIFIVTIYIIEENYPKTNIKEYKKVYKIFKNTELGEYLPKKVNDDYITKMYYSIGFLQGTIFKLETELDSEILEEYKEKLSQEDNFPVEKSIINNNEVYEKNGYETYYLKAQCDDSGYCNHGIDIHISIRSKSNEIIFFYSDW